MNKATHEVLLWLANDMNPSDQEKRKWERKTLVSQESVSQLAALTYQWIVPVSHYL